MLGSFLLAVLYPHLQLRYYPPVVSAAWAVWSLSLLTWLIVIWWLCPRLREGRDGVAFMILLPLLVVMFFVREWPCAVEKAAGATCSGNLKAIATAFYQYAADHGNRFPEQGTWVESIRPYLSNSEALHCRKDFSHAPVSYAMNVRLSGVSLDEVAYPMETVLIFDGGPPSKKLTGGRRDLTARHLEGANVAFVDGHMKYTTRRMLGKLRWKP